MLPTRLKLLVPLLFFGAAFGGKQVYDKRRKKQRGLLKEKLEGFTQIESLPSLLALSSNILTPVSDKEHRLLLAKRYLQLVNAEHERHNSEYLVGPWRNLEHTAWEKRERKEWLDAVLGQRICTYLTFLARERADEYDTQQLACQALSVILAKGAFYRSEKELIRQSLRRAFAMEPMLIPELCLMPNIDPLLLEEASVAVGDEAQKEMQERDSFNDKRNIILALGELWMATVQRKEGSNSSIDYSPVDDYGFSSPTSEWDPLTDPTMSLKSVRAMLRMMNEAVVKDDLAAFRILHSNGLSILKALVDTAITEEWWKKSKDTINLVLTEVARLVANLVLHKEGTQLAIGLQWPETFLEWLYHEDDDELGNSKDGMLQLEAIRAISNMQPERKWKYPNGIFLLYPTCRRRWEAQMDIVLVHGLLGGPLRTWRVACDESHNDNNNDNHSNNNNIVEEEYYYTSEDTDSVVASKQDPQPSHEKQDHEKLVVWPRDWLSRDIPNIRILSVSYDTSISAWRSYGLPLEHQATDLLNKLCVAGIGTRPCVIITHSYGGLVTKQAIVDAFHSNEEKHRRFVDSIRGIVFYSTPHLGSPIVGYLKRAIVGSTFRPSVAVNELYPGSTMLLELNEEFKKLVQRRWHDYMGTNPASKSDSRHNHLMQVLSMGETCATKLTRWSRSYITSLLVPVETANPGIGHFIPIQGADHLTVCKPSSVDDLRYQEVVKLIQRAMKASSRVDNHRIKVWVNN